MRFKGAKVLEYTFLTAGFFTIVLLLWIYRFDRNTEIVISGIGSLLYTLWGLVHHKLEDRLNLEIALEYILISVFVFLLVFTALSV